MTQGSYTHAKTLADMEMYPPRIDFVISSFSTHQDSLVCDIIIQGFYSNEYNTQKPCFTLFAPPQQFNLPILPQHVHSSTNYIAALTEAQRNTSVTKDVLLKIVYHISNWQTVGHYLNISKSSIQHIQDHDPCPGEGEWAYQVLLKWYNENEPTQRTYGVLITALQNSNEIQVIEKLMEILRS